MPSLSAVDPRREALEPRPMLAEALGGGRRAATADGDACFGVDLGTSDMRVVVAADGELRAVRLDWRGTAYAHSRSAARVCRVHPAGDSCTLPGAGASFVDVLPEAAGFLPQPRLFLTPLANASAAREGV